MEIKIEYLYPIPNTYNLVLNVAWHCSTIGLVESLNHVASQVSRPPKTWILILLTERWKEDVEVTEKISIIRGLNGTWATWREAWSYWEVRSEKKDHGSVEKWQGLFLWQKNNNKPFIVPDFSPKVKPKEWMVLDLFQTRMWGFGPTWDTLGHRCLATLTFVLGCW